MTEMLKNRRFAAEVVGVVALLLILGLQLFLSVRWQSQTWDEANHIFAGYMSLKNRDFGLNPEHPPLVKMLATAPLFLMPLNVPELQNRFFKEEAFLGGREFLFFKVADAILICVRVYAA